MYALQACATARISSCRACAHTRVRVGCAARGGCAALRVAEAGWRGYADAMRLRFCPVAAPPRTRGARRRGRIAARAAAPCKEADRGSASLRRTTGGMCGAANAAMQRGAARRRMQRRMHRPWPRRRRSCPHCCSRPWWAPLRAACARSRRFRLLAGPRRRTTFCGAELLFAESLTRPQEELPAAPVVCTALYPPISPRAFLLPSLPSPLPPTGAAAAPPRTHGACTPEQRCGACLQISLHGYCRLAMCPAPPPPPPPARTRAAPHPRRTSTHGARRPRDRARADAANALCALLALWPSSPFSVGTPPPLLAIRVCRHAGLRAPTRVHALQARGPPRGARHASARHLH
jgi:hypothetical protein